MLGADQFRDFSRDDTQALFRRYNISYGSLEEVIGNIARAMTVNIWTGPTTSQEMTGWASRDVIAVRIQWFWIILPFVLVILVLSFLALVIQKQGRGLIFSHGRTVSWPFCSMILTLKLAVHLVYSAA